MKSYPSEGLSSWGDIWIRSGWTVQQHAATGEARLRNPAGACLRRGTTEACIAAAQSHAPRNDTKRAAMLLHGLWHHRGVMQRLEDALHAQGWATANMGYSSRLRPLDAHAATASAIARCLAEDGAGEIAFIGHSLGGLISRAAMARAARDGWRTGPLAAIGSPARGAGFVTLLNRIPFCETAIGACYPALIPNTAVPPPATDRVLIIAGGNGHRGYNPIIPGDNDALVSIAETRLPGYETAFCRIPAHHRALPGRVEAIATTLKFLEEESSFL